MEEFVIQMRQQNKINMNFEVNLVSVIEASVAQLTISQGSVSMSEVIEANSIVAKEMPWQTNPNHDDQFNKIYMSRLKKIGKRVPLRNVRKVEEVEGRLGKVELVGIFKRLEFNRKKAFQEDFEGHYEKLETIYDEKDTLELEDLTGRLKFIFSEGVKLNGQDFKLTDLPYGIIIGLIGYYVDVKHCFIAEEIYLPELASQRPLIKKQLDRPRKTLIVSEPTVEAVNALLVEIVDLRFSQVKKQIKSLIIMGFNQALTSADIRKLNALFSDYAKHIDIFVMPGNQTKQVFPQKPLHPMLFKSCYNDVSFVSNPQVFMANPEENHASLPSQEIDSAKMLLFSGQNIRNLIKNCSLSTSSLDTLQSVIEYSHMAPTAPFSLPSWMMPEDYLVIEELPHLMLAGQCEQFMVRDYIGKGGQVVRLVAVKSGEMVLVDIDNLEVCKYTIKQ